MSKHTPGPWNAGTYQVEANDGTLVCNMSGWRNPQASLANATLISAAPELLAALKDYVGPDIDLTNAPCHFGITTADKCGRCSREIKARAAIAKAEGPNHA